MKSSINLVSKRRKPNAFHKRFLIICVTFFSIVFLTSVGLIAYRLLLQSQLSELEAEEATLISVVNENPEKKVKFLTVRERLSEIQNILSERKNLNIRIAGVEEVLPIDVGVKLIESDEETVKFRVAAPNLVSLNNLIEQRIEEYANEQGKAIKRIEMTSFNLDPSSLQYEANFTIEFI